MTSERCDFRTERECSCNAGECRVQNLGTFTKPLPAPPIDTTTPQYALIGGITFALCWAVFVFVAVPAYRAMDRVNQEQVVTWAK